MAIDNQLQKVVDYLVSTEEQISTKSRTNGERPWLNYEEVTKAGKFEFSKVAEIFTRQDSNNNYARLSSNAQSEDKELKTAKLSADFLAGCERDYRLRTRSRVRFMVHAAVNASAANGLPIGPLRVNTLGWFNRILAREKQED